MNSSRPQASLDELRAQARQIRRYVLHQARSRGHGYVGQGMQAADIFACLFFSELHWSAHDLADPLRDRFLLSTGHYAIALYASLVVAGVLRREQLDGYGVDGSPFTLGTEPGEIPAVEFAGGSLGQGLGVAAGLAWGLRFNKNPARVLNYMSDGEVQEGATWEAAMLAGAQGLDNLINIIDVNRTQADGPLVLEIEPLADKYRAFNWWVTEVDGNDMAALRGAFDAARTVTGQPKAIICHTRIGAGSSKLMSYPKAHFVRVTEQDWNDIMNEFECSDEPQTEHLA